MKKDNKFLDKTTLIITIVCIVVLTITGTIFLKLETKNQSEIIKSDESDSIIEKIEKANSKDYEYDASIYGLININTAPKEELMRLDDIGDKKARDIINYREKNPFKKIQDITKVEGIGQKTFNKIKDKICVE